MTRITKVTIVMITMITEIRITVRVKRKINKSINNDNNTATQVAIKAETISNRKQQKNEKNLLSIKYLQ